MTIRTPRRLEFAQFPTAYYPTLNGPKPLSATKLDIERSLLMVGYPSARAAAVAVGHWRARLLSALVQGYLTPTLRPSRYFLGLEPSERVSTTFLLAQAFTHWAADAYMSIPVLLHVHGATPSWTLAPMPVSGKTGAGPIKDKSRPDFIGIEPGAYHVFESKGRSLPPNSKSKSSTVAAGCMSDALAQVSRIGTIMGAAPKTRTAAVWVLRQSGLRGYVTDPPAVRRSYDLRFDLSKALAKYYRIVLDAAEALPSRGTGEVARYLLSENRELFVDRKLLELLRGLESGLVGGQEVLALLERRAARYRRARQIAARSTQLALGLDGVGLASASKDIEDWLGPPEDERI